MLNDIYNKRIIELAGNIPRLGRLAAPDASATSGVAIEAAAFWNNTNLVIDTVTGGSGATSYGIYAPVAGSGTVISANTNHRVIRLHSSAQIRHSGGGAARGSLLQRVRGVTASERRPRNGR